LAARVVAATRGRDVCKWHIAAPDVCDGTSAVVESRHRIPGASVGQPERLPVEHRSDINPLALLGLRLITAPHAVPSPGSTMAIALHDFDVSIPTKASV
jgi:hypothetical protein